MPDEMQQDPGVVATPASATDGGLPLGAHAGADSGDEGTTPPAATAKAEPKVVTVPTSAMRRIKEEEFSRGKQMALDELAKAAGYESNADFVQALAKLKSAPVSAPAATQSHPSSASTIDEGNDDPAQDLAKAKDVRREEGRFQRQLEKVLGERNKYAQAAQNWQTRAREAQAEADAVRAEMHLRTIAAGVGVQDIDYAIALFSREVDRLTPEQAEKFDERTFFEGLRKTKPLLFGEAVVPATTGTGTGGVPTPPKPGQVAAQNGANGRVDARKMNPRDFAAELAKRGINPHGAV